MAQLSRQLRSQDRGDSAFERDFPTLAEVAKSACLVVTATLRKANTEPDVAVIFCEPPGTAGIVNDFVPVPFDPMLAVPSDLLPIFTVALVFFGEPVSVGVTDEPTRADEAESVNLGYV